MDNIDFSLLYKIIDKFESNPPTEKFLSKGNDHNFTLNSHKLLYATQIFYSSYIRHYGIVQIGNVIKKIKNSRKRKWAEYLLAHSNEIKEFANNNFDLELYDISANLNISYNLLDSVFSSHRPFMIFNDYLEFGIKNLSDDNFEYFYILLLIFLKDDIDSDNYLTIQRDILNKFLKSNANSNESIINKILNVFEQINKSKYLDVKLSLSIYEILYGDTQPPLNGDIYIFWNNVVFKNGYYFIYHPLFPNGEDGRLPLRIEEKLSRKEFNNIHSYFKRKLNPIYATAINGEIKNVKNKQSLSDCIQIIKDKIISQNTNIGENKTTHKEFYSKKEAIEKVKLHKSNFLNYLSNEQLEEYKVIYCTENKIDSNKNNIIEHSFIFTIKNKNNEIKIIYENTEVRRCTYSFVSSKDSWQRDIESISDFFISDKINKRLNIARKNYVFNLSKNLHCTRIIHKDIEDWMQEINQ